jgi:hypothetical protein
MTMDSITESNQQRQNDMGTGAKQLAGMVEEVSPEEVAKESSNIVGGIMEFGSGITGGWTDEIFGATQRALPYPYGMARGKNETDEEYRAASAAPYRERQEVFRKENPLTAVGLNVLGAVPTTIATGGLMNATAKGGQMLNALNNMNRLKKSATIGGIGGTMFGAGEADTGETLQGAVGGGITGALFGFGFPLATDFTKYVGGKIASPFVSMYKKFDNPTREAVNELVRYFERDGMSPDDAVKLLNNLGDDAVLADAGKDNIRGLMDYIANSPNSAAVASKEFLEERVKMQSSQVNSLVSRLLGTKGAVMNKQLLKDLTTQQQKVAAPLYKQARESGFDFKGSEIDEILLSLPDEAFTLANKFARTNRAVFKKLLNQNADGDNVVAVSYGVDEVDNIKKGLDQIIFGELKEGKMSPYGRELIRLKNHMLTLADEAVPEYGAARSAWAGHEATKNSMKAGRDFFKMDVDDIDELMDGSTASDKLFYKMGVARAIRDKLDRYKKTGDASGFFTRGDVERKLGTIFDDPKQLDDFVTNIEVLGEKADMNRMIYNSRTMPRQQIKEDIEGIAGDAPTSAANAAFQFMSGDKSKAVEPIRNEIGRILMMQNPEEISRILSSGGAPASLNPFPLMNRSLEGFMGKNKNILPMLPAYMLGQQTGG